MHTGLCTGGVISTLILLSLSAQPACTANEFLHLHCRPMILCPPCSDSDLLPTLDSEYVPAPNQMVTTGAGAERARAADSPRRRRDRTNKLNSPTTLCDARSGTVPSGCRLRRVPDFDSDYCSLSDLFAGSECNVTYTRFTV
ncbi:hypothetical protein EVAR_100172_1 [Eumeta japonica]|uniref:Uncharacterized protein n=1 Tax=Eumeta variegata TaxID=151549 RepID=A0A4C2A8J2_EUMVA|nr:hypothetical protein EVAR_100172_1 [Eumeta japonica]